MKRTLITSALPYANGYLHLGHCAGAYLPADIYARFLRLSGIDVLYVCGSDEHGVAITIAAEKEKTTPEGIIEKYHIANRTAFQKFGISFDIYSRTSSPRHQSTTKEFFADFMQKGLLREREEDQFYDPKVEMFLPDRYVEGVCPNCGYDKARGDQCDNCGAYYNQLELKNPKSLVSGETPIVRKTTHWYMKFNELQPFLEEYVESHGKDWKDNVLQQTRSWLKQGLNERAITRDLSWGIKIDDIPGIPKEVAAGKVIYVWFDAVLGYITATKIWALFRENEGHGSREDWKKWWQDPETRYIAFIGKDNIVFHTLIFPAMLHARGDGYILPDNVPANDFLNLEGQKFSKSRNWTIDLQDFITDFPDPQSIDTMRYTLATILPEMRDSDFTWKDFQARNNNELAAIFGNFINRTMQFIHKNFNGEVPTLPDEHKDFPNEWKRLANYINENNNGEIDRSLFPKLSDNDFELIKSLTTGINKISFNYNKFRFRDGVSETVNIARAANKYFNDEEPWKTLRHEPDKCAKSLYACLQIVRSLAVVFAPIVPNTCKKIFEMLNITAETGEPAIVESNINFWQNAAIPILPEGLVTHKPEILFTKIEDETIAVQIAKLGNLTAQGTTEPQTEQEELITIDDFKKIKLRTAKVLEAEKLPKSKKLIKLQVEIGSEKRQILAGIAEHYDPKDLIGKTIVVVSNLQPAKLMGQESKGMLLAANSSDGKLCIVSVDDEEIPSGAEVR